MSGKLVVALSIVAMMVVCCSSSDDDTTAVPDSGQAYPGGEYYDSGPGGGGTAVPGGTDPSGGGSDPGSDPSGGGSDPGSGGSDPGSGGGTDPGGSGTSGGNSGVPCTPGQNNCPAGDTCMIVSGGDQTKGICLQKCTTKDAACPVAQTGQKSTCFLNFTGPPAALYCAYFCQLSGQTYPCPAGSSCNMISGSTGICVQGSAGSGGGGGTAADAGSSGGGGGGTGANTGSSCVPAQNNCSGGDSCIIINGGNPSTGMCLSKCTSDANCSAAAGQKSTCFLTMTGTTDKYCVFVCKDSGGTYSCPAGSDCKSIGTTTSICMQK